MTELPIINYDDPPTEQVMTLMNNLTKYNDINPKLFIRGSDIVRVVEIDRGSLVLETVNESALRVESYNCVKYHNSRNREARMPIDIVRDVMSGSKRTRLFPRISGITRTPIMHYDGSVNLNTGYDKLTEMYYSPRDDIKDISLLRNPERHDINEALRLIWEPFRDFRFKSKADGTHVLAALFTVVFRNLIDGSVPLLLIDKPQAGTGASLISQVIGLISEGGEPIVTSMPHGEEEFRKVVISILLTGRSTVILDNIENKLQSPTLAALITSIDYSDRKLGTNENITLPNRVVWIGNGNNVELAGDLPRRVYWTRMDSETVRPWAEHRNFIHRDLKSWVRKHRSEILGAMFTIVKGWINAGRPGPKIIIPEMGGFEQWREFIGGIFEYCHIEGFLGNVQQMYEEADTETPEWTVFVDALYQKYGEESFFTKDIFKEITPRKEYGNIYYLNEDLRDALPEQFLDTTEKEGSFSRMMGKAFSKRKDRRYPGGYKIETDGAYNRSVKWRICKYEFQSSLEGTLVDIFDKAE